MNSDENERPMSTNWRAGEKKGARRVRQSGSTVVAARLQPRRISTLSADLDRTYLGTPSTNALSALTFTALIHRNIPAVIPG